MQKRIICFLTSSIFAVAAAAATRTVDTSHATLMKWASEHGFQLRTEGGEEVYCRQVVPLDSRIPVTQCGSEAELAAYMQSAAENGLPL